MTAKEFVKDKMPNAIAERHKKGMIKELQEVYYLIRERGQTMYVAEGNTESNAWVNAKKFLIRRDTI